MIKILKATTTHAAEVREIAKQFGIKGCRLGTSCVIIGRQGKPVGSQVAHQFMDAVKANGFLLDSEDTLRELADKELSDSFMVYKLA